MQCINCRSNILIVNLISRSTNTRRFTYHCTTMKHALLFILAIVVLTSYSCMNTTEYQADELTITELSSQPGYAWFSQEVAKYTPSPSDVAAIKSSYASAPFSTYLYVNPSCTCTGTQKHFPHLYSTLKAAGIPDSTMIVLSMLNATTAQPYADKFPVRVLPTFYFVRSSGNDTRKLEPPSDTLSRIDSLAAVVLR